MGLRPLEDGGICSRRVQDLHALLPLEERALEGINNAIALLPCASGGPQERSECARKCRHFEGEGKGRGEGGGWNWFEWREVLMIWRLGRARVAYFLVHGWIHFTGARDHIFPPFRLRMFTLLHSEVNWPEIGESGLFDLVKDALK